MESELAVIDIGNLRVESVFQYLLGNLTKINKARSWVASKQCQKMGDEKKSFSCHGNRK